MMENAADFWGYCTLFCSKGNNSPDDYTKIQSKIERIRMASDEIDSMLEVLKVKIPSDYSERFDIYQENLLKAVGLYTASMFVSYFAFSDDQVNKENEIDNWKQVVEEQGKSSDCVDIAVKIMKEIVNESEYKDELNLSDFFFRRCQRELLKCYTELDCFLSEICQTKHFK